MTFTAFDLWPLPRPVKHIPPPGWVPTYKRWQHERQASHFVRVLRGNGTWVQLKCSCGLGWNGHADDDTAAQLIVRHLLSPIP